MPHWLIHECLLTNSKPAEPAGNLINIHTDIAPVETLVTSAASLTHSPCVRLISETTIAPKSGSNTRIVRIGNSTTPDSDAITRCS